MSGNCGEYDERLALADDELARLVRRLRSLSALAWTRRRPPVVLALGRLAALAALAEQRSLPEPPEIADHVLADAMTVIAGEAIVALTNRPNDELLTALIAEVRDVLAATR